MRIKKSISLISLAAVVLAVSFLYGCGNAKRAEMNESGFTIAEDESAYLLCSPFALKPITVGEVYAAAGDTSFYRIPYQDPSEFLCDKDAASGSSYVYRSKQLPEVTLESFGAVAAWVYIEGIESTMVGQFYADDEFLPEEKRGLNPSQDTSLVRKIASALSSGTAVEVPDSSYTDADTFYIRMLGPNYPGLYYNVCFFADKEGNYYLEDMGTFKIVDCPAEVAIRMVGE